MTSPVCPQLQTNCCVTANVERGHFQTHALQQSQGRSGARSGRRAADELHRTGQTSARAIHPNAVDLKN